MLYDVLKFLHVAFVIIWLGSAFGLVFLAARAARARDDAGFVHAVGDMVYMARVFIPSALLALVSGVAMAWQIWGFTPVWIVIGLLGFALTFGTGMLVIKPRSEKAIADKEREGITPAVVQQCRVILRVTQFDLTMLFVIVADMVLKPQAQDLATLAAMAVVLLAAAFFFLGRLRPAVPAAA